MVAPNVLPSRPEAPRQQRMGRVREVSNSCPCFLMLNVDREQLHRAREVPDQCRDLQLSLLRLHGAPQVDASLPLVVIALVYCGTHVWCFSMQPRYRQPLGGDSLRSPSGDSGFAFGHSGYRGSGGPNGHQWTLLTHPEA
jgi:hypothetical protein